MDLEEAEAAVRDLSRELAEQMAALEASSRKVTGIAKILRAYADMFPELAERVNDAVAGRPLPEDDSPRGAEAVRIVLQDSPKSSWYVSRMVTELRDRGWLPDSENPANAVRAALDRLVSSPESDVYKIRYRDKTVAYMYDPDYDREAADDPVPPAYEDEEPF
jgi:hypothetical protein